MRILYGVCGEGMGHATRAIVVGAHLESLGHEVRYATMPGPAHNFLTERASRPVLRVLGPTAIYQKHAVTIPQTLLANALRAMVAPLANLPALLTGAGEKPEAVISDFDPWSAYLAHALHLPLLAVDNIHFMSRCSHPRPDSDDLPAALAARPFVEAFVPAASHYHVLTFAAAEVSRPDTTLHLPVLRPELLARRNQTTSGDHVVVYLNSQADHPAAVRALAEAGVTAHLYGVPGGKQSSSFGSVTLLPFSEESFLDDLASCRAVVASAGFSLMTEAIYLGKPVLALPLGGQYEQILNSVYLERLGYGRRCRHLTAESVRGFLDSAPSFAQNLRGLPHDDNRRLLDAVSGELSS